MTDAENVDWDVCPECGMELEEKETHSYDIHNLWKKVHCPNCGYEEE